MTINNQKSMKKFIAWLVPPLYSVRSDFSVLLLRVIFGSLMLVHGWGKFHMMLSGDIQFADPIGLGETPSLYLSVFAELFCAGFVMIGLCTRLACIPLMITMLVAIFIVHGSDPLEKKELAILYLAAFYVIYLLGPGRLSLDQQLFNTRIDSTK